MTKYSQSESSNIECIVNLDQLGCHLGMQCWSIIREAVRLYTTLLSEGGGSHYPFNSCRKVILQNPTAFCGKNTQTTKNRKECFFFFICICTKIFLVDRLFLFILFDIHRASWIWGLMSFISSENFPASISSTIFFCPVLSFFTFFLGL